MKLDFWLKFMIFVFVCYEYRPIQAVVSSYYDLVAFFDENDLQPQMPFKSAVRKSNLMNLKAGFKQNMHIISNLDSFGASKLFCGITATTTGLVGVFGPESLSTSAMLKSICENMKIPFIKTTWDYKVALINDEMTVNFFPDSNLFSLGLSTIVKHLEWQSFVILYEDNAGLIKLQDVLKFQKYSTNNKQQSIKVRHLGTGPDYRPLLKDIKNSSETHIILDCATHKIFSILKQAKEVNLLEIFHNFFLTSLDAHTVDLSSLNVNANITSIRIFDPETDLFKHTLQGWALNEEYSGHYVNLSNYMISTKTVLMHDAVTTFVDAVNALYVTGTIVPQKLNCSDSRKWSDGFRISSFLKIKTPPETILSKPLKFDPATGHRTDFLIYVVQGTKNKVTATWSVNHPHDLNMTASGNDKMKAIVESLQKGTVIVASRIGAPYLINRKKQSENEVLKGNDRYEGYSMDLIHAISQILNFTYEFKIVQDYGKLDPKTKQWNGLIRELLDHRAHLAICDLTITHQRREAVDFSMPFMTLGISILYKTETEKDVNMFAFLDPFSIDVWIYTATLYLTVSIILFFISRLSPGDWENPHQCDENPEELENIWDLKNCMWLTLGSIMTQGCDILPKGVSSRMAASMWWFFSLIMTSSYTANLAAFLTMERMEPSIDSAEALSKQTKIKYGTVSGGATQAFFRESNYSTYQRMWTNMISNKPSVFEKENQGGVKRVRTTRNGLYAFLMESSQIEYEIETKCDLKQVGNWLDSKGYGIAMPVNSAYRSAINTAVLKLQEDGKLQELKTKWWKKMRDEPSCSETAKSETSSAELALANVGGVFLVLGLGILVAFIIAILEFLWNVRNISVEEHISYWEAFKEEFKFALNVCVTKKSTKSKTLTSRTNSADDSRSMGRLIQGSGGSMSKLGTNKNGSTKLFEK